jgi:hypothetical protein
MSQEVFTASWVRRWADDLAASDDYRRAAAKWEGSLVIEMAADPALGVGEDRGVLLDLWHGECRAARIAGDGFRRFLDEVASEHGTLSRFHGPCYRAVFYTELPQAMARLRHDASPAAQAEAV